MKGVGNKRKYEIALNSPIHYYLNKLPTTQQISYSSRKAVKLKMSSLVTTGGKIQ